MPHIEQLQLADAAFDLVSSSLALHYVESFAAVCATVQRLLTSGGHFVFSVEHPIFTAPSNPGWQIDPAGTTIWPLNDYLREGARVTNWITAGVVKQHRTIASYVNSLLAHRFQLTHLDEWGPNAAQIAEYPEWANEIHRPPFLLVGARLQPRDQN